MRPPRDPAFRNVARGGGEGQTESSAETRSANDEQSRPGGRGDPPPDERPPLLVAIDGRSGSGKSTLARSVAREFGAAVVVADDFYSGGNDSYWLSVAAEDRAGRVLDWRRLRREALKPLLDRRHAMWHPLDFEPGVGWLGWKDETVSVAPSDIVIVDGAYSARPELEDLIDLSVLVEATETVRNGRLLAREGEDFMRRWHALWDAAEDLYFGGLRPQESLGLGSGGAHSSSRSGPSRRVRRLCGGCEAAGTFGQVEWFKFKIKPNGRQELWRYGGHGSCTITASLIGSGLLNVSLRGY